MGNKREKPIPVELDDDALCNVSGGTGSTVAANASQQDSGAHGSSYAGGIAGYASSGEIKNC